MSTSKAKLQNFSAPVDAYGVPTVQPKETRRMVSCCRWWKHKYASTGTIYRDGAWNMNYQELKCMICNHLKFKQL